MPFSLGPGLAQVPSYPSMGKEQPVGADSQKGDAAPGAKLTPPCVGKGSPDSFVLQKHWEAVLCF